MKLVRKAPTCIGIGLLSAGICLLLSCFLPNIIIVCLEAVLLILAGFILLKN
jgi:hypothetical protein